jgi:hypothetical protein
MNDGADARLAKRRGRLTAILLTCSLLSAPAGAAGSLDQALLKLEPEERVRQVCVNRGLGLVRRDARLRGADRMKTSILSPAVHNGTLLTAKGAAVRSNHRWFVLSFTCQVAKDTLQATSFTFELGQEIPKDKWESYGLWE